MALMYSSGTRKTRLHTRLIELQSGRSDREMAQMLGIDRTSWVHIRRGRGLSLRMIERAIRAFPELHYLHARDMDPAERLSA